MSIEDNKAIARVWFEEIINNRNLDALDEAYAPSYVHRGPNGHEMGRSDARQVAERLLAESSDRRARAICQIAEGDIVVTRWESRGTRIDEPDAPERVVQGIVISRIADGQIVEDWEMVHFSQHGP